jgi:hypothetical protein
LFAYVHKEKVKYHYPGDPRIDGFSAAWSADDEFCATDDEIVGFDL